MFPLRSRTGGVLARTGQTEAAVDLARIAGLYPAGVICEVMNEDGTMARVPQLARFAKRHGLLMVTVADLIKYRMHTESLVKRVASAKMPTDHGDFRVHAFENQVDHQTHVALVRGDIGDGKDVLVRVHSSCLTGDGLHSIRCDCGAQLDAAMREDRRRKAAACCCISIRKGAASASRTRSAPTSCRTRASTRSKPTSALGFKADQRDYGMGVQILRELGVRSDAAAQQQPPQAGRHRRLRPVDQRMAAARDSGVRLDAAVSEDEEREDGTQALFGVVGELVNW